MPGDDHNTQWKFALTNSMILPTIYWFHIILGNPGSCHMHATLQAQYHHPHLQMHIERFTCDKCQQAEPSGPGHGLLPDWDIAKLQLILLSHGLSQHHMVCPHPPPI